MKPKLFFTICLILAIAILPLASFSSLASAEGTNKNGIISSNDVWTKAGSPYTLTGPVAVKDGVTLTIEAGVTINLNSYYILVNGTVKAQGTTIDPIIFNNGYIKFLESDEGCIIENSILNTTSTYNIISIFSSSPKIDQSTINGVIQVQKNSNPIISNNIIKGKIVDTSQGTTTISNNIITNPSFSSDSYGIHAERSSGVISGNTISNCQAGIFAYNANPTISQNTIFECQKGIWVVSESSPIIEKNCIYGNTEGINIISGSASVEINTIVNNTKGIYVGHEQKYFAGYFYIEPSPSIVNNNIYSNGDANFFLDTPKNITVADNWWGTTDESAISQSIYDSKNDFNLGTVTFQPILTSPNQNAPTLPTATSTPTPAPSPTVPEFPETVVLLIMLVAAMAAVICIKSGRTRIEK